MLRATEGMRESGLRDLVVQCGKICYDRRLMSSNDGNISVRLDDRRILITPAGACKGRLTAANLVLLGQDGANTPGGATSGASSETPMHLEVYRRRPDVGAVIHAHPIFATALTVAGLEFPTDVLPEILLLLGEVPVTQYAMPGTDDDAQAIRPFVAGHCAILLRQHGALTFGRDLEEALQHMERLEHVAEVFWRARTLGPVQHLADADRRKLASARPHQSES
jgi:L-fuculose-phosphate aldolase